MHSGDGLYEANMKGGELLIIYCQRGYKLYTKSRGLRHRDTTVWFQTEVQT
jgi:hypothetical protein